MYANLEFRIIKCELSPNVCNSIKLELQYDQHNLPCIIRRQKIIAKITTTITTFFNNFGYVTAVYQMSAYKLRMR